jgi:hypothetical protein
LNKNNVIVVMWWCTFHPLMPYSHMPSGTRDSFSPHSWRNDTEYRTVVRRSVISTQPESWLEKDFLNAFLVKLICSMGQGTLWLL